jgi:hypothetical protein
VKRDRLGQLRYVERPASRPDCNHMHELASSDFVYITGNSLVPIPKMRVVFVYEVKVTWVNTFFISSIIQ